MIAESAQSANNSESLIILKGRLIIAMAHDIDIEVDVAIDIEVVDVEALRIILLQLFNLMARNGDISMVNLWKWFRGGNNIVNKPHSR